MAFKGSTHVPPGEMIKILERKGLAFGPDTNAETEWTQTVYQLDLPRSDQGLIDTGLMLMRETGGNLLIEPKSAGHRTRRGALGGAAARHARIPGDEGPDRSAWTRSAASPSGFPSARWTSSRPRPPA